MNDREMTSKGAGREESGTYRRPAGPNNPGKAVWDSQAFHGQKTQHGEANEPAIFERSVSEVIPDLRKQAVRLTGSDSDAEDLLQDSVLRAWRFRDRFEAGTNLRAWLRRIVLNTFLTEKRRVKREQLRMELVRREHEDIEVEECVTPNHSLESKHAGEDVLSAIATLPPNFQEVLRLVDLEQRSYKDTAAQLGCPIGTVMSRLNRARHALKKALEAQKAVGPSHGSLEATG